MFSIRGWMSTVFYLMLGAVTLDAIVSDKRRRTRTLARDSSDPSNTIRTVPIPWRFGDRRQCQKDSVGVRGTAVIVPPRWLVKPVKCPPMLPCGDNIFKTLLTTTINVMDYWIRVLPSHSFGGTLQKSRYKTVAQLNADVCWPSE